jgi:hypothetical protein
LPSDSNFTAEVEAEDIGGPTIDIDKDLCVDMGVGRSSSERTSETNDGTHHRHRFGWSVDISVAFIKGLQWYTPWGIPEAEERSAWTQ